MNPLPNKVPQKATARRSIAATLTQEILARADTYDFPTGSEHQLCRRFGVSRVTVRLALLDLEHRRLIYRKHGRGTFAYGSLTRTHPNIGILAKSPEDIKSPEFVEFTRGALTVMASLHSSVVLIAHPPLTWRAETTHAFGGVIVFQCELTKDESDNLTKRKIPFIDVPTSHHDAEATDYYELGMCTAKRLSKAFMTGEPVSERKGQELTKV